MQEIDQDTLRKLANEWFEDHDLGPFKLIDDDPLKDLNGVYYKSRCKKCGNAVSIRIDCSPFRMVGEHCYSSQEVANQNKIAAEINSKMQGRDWENIEELDSADITRIRRGVEGLFQLEDADISQYLEQVEKPQIEAILNALSVLYFKKISGVHLQADRFRKKFGSPKQWRGCDVFTNAENVGNSDQLMITKAIVVIPNTTIRIFYKYRHDKEDELSIYGLANAEMGAIEKAVRLITPFKKLVYGNRGKGRPRKSMYDSYAKRVIRGEDMNTVVGDAAEKIGVEYDSARRSIERRIERLKMDN